MKLNALSEAQIAKIKRYRYDWFVEKHEGPWDWAGMLRYQSPDFLDAEGRAVLLPVDREHHPNIRILRCIPSMDGETLTLFLQDTTFYEGDFSGFLAVCERVSGESWYITTVYHEWYLMDYVLAREPEED